MDSKGPVLRPRRRPPPPTQAEPEPPQPDVDADLARLERVREARAAVHNPAVRRYGARLRRWYDDLPVERKHAIGAQEVAAAAASSAEGADVPMRFRLLALPGVDDATRARLVRKAEVLSSMDDGNGERYKLMTYLDSLCRLPLGRTRAPSLPPTDDGLAVRGFLAALQAHMDVAVYGHADTKDAVLRLAAQWIARPESLGGTVVGLSGPAGVGKTTVVKVLADALGLPMAFVPLGGAQDGAYLEGHGFTYEGSTHGRISDAVTRAGCMNPVLVFDELDKISPTAKGAEVHGILTHLTDPTQNSHFEDKYYADVRLDLSRALFVFTMNDEEAVPAVLRDRMRIIRLGGYSREDKLRIARDHLVPSVVASYGSQAAVAEDALAYLVDRCMDAPGVRGLRRAIDAVMGGVNLRHLSGEASASAASIEMRVTLADARTYAPPRENSGSAVTNMMYL